MIADSARRQEERHDQLAQQLATQKGSFGTLGWIFDSLVLLCGARWPDLSRTSFIRRKVAAF